MAFAAGAETVLTMLTMLRKRAASVSPAAIPALEAPLVEAAYRGHRKRVRLDLRRRPQGLRNRPTGRPDALQRSSIRDGRSKRPAAPALISIGSTWRGRDRQQHLKACVHHLVGGGRGGAWTASLNESRP
jgi:hypothetical protein